MVDSTTYNDSLSSEVSVTKKILATRNNGETQIFVLNGDIAESFYTARDDDPPRLIGSIFNGRVKNILAGMQAAFVDIGRDRNAFLQYDKRIRLRIGDNVLIQIEKDADKFKSPRATLNISLPGRKIVLMPTVGYIGLSQRIPLHDKDRLHALIKKIRPHNIGVIVRSAALNSTETEIAAEFDEQMQLWRSILELSHKRKSPALIWSDDDLPARIIREEISSEVEFLTDSLKIYRRISEIVNKKYPAFVDRIHYCEDTDLFKQFGVDIEIRQLREKELPLPSGGFIVIEKTEALTAVDVNTGSFAGNHDLAETIYQTNIEAADLIMKQLRLRNVSGIIIADFIDMPEEYQRDNLMRHLRKLAQIDRSTTKIVDMTPLGLVEITRRHSHQA